MNSEPKCWRTLLRFSDMKTEGNETFYSVVIPGWKADVTLVYRESELDMRPEVVNFIQDEIKDKGVSRIAAMVNLEAEKAEDLFLSGFQFFSNKH